LFSELGRMTCEKASPVEVYVASSTPVMRAPSETGNVDLTCETSMPCRTTAFKSP